jgi:hypothetical protein
MPDEEGVAPGLHVLLRVQRPQLGPGRWRDCYSGWRRIVEVPAAALGLPLPAGATLAVAALAVRSTLAVAHLRLAPPDIDPQERGVAVASAMALGAVSLQMPGRYFATIHHKWAELHSRQNFPPCGFQPGCRGTCLHPRARMSNGNRRCGITISSVRRSAPMAGLQRLTGRPDAAVVAQPNQ